MMRHIKKFTKRLRSRKQAQQKVITGTDRLIREYRGTFKRLSEYDRTH